MDTKMRNSGAIKKMTEDYLEGQNVHVRNKLKTNTSFIMKRTFKGDIQNSDSIENEKKFERSKIKDKKSSFIMHCTEKGDPINHESVEKSIKSIDYNDPFFKNEFRIEGKVVPDDTVSEDGELLELPSKEIWGRTSHTNLNNLYSLSPKPQPPLTERHLKKIQQNHDPASLMIEKVNKLKNGMKRLQEITQKFNCTDRYKMDVDYIVKNIGRALNESEKLRNKKECHTSTSESS